MNEWKVAHGKYNAGISSIDQEIKQGRGVET